MTLQEIALPCAAAFSSALLSFDIHAEARGWPVGRWFATQKAAMLAMVCAVILLAFAGYHAFAGTGWWALWCVLGGWYVGGPFVLSFFGRRGPAYHLILAPVLTIFATV